jgi:hypothetical protein
VFAKPSSAILVVAIVLLLSAPASAAIETLRGRLVDQACYLIDTRNTGDSHPGMATDCATTCAQKGSPVALLTANGRLYEVTGGLAANNNALLIPHIAHIVEIRGEVTVYRDGTRSIAADSLKMITR